MSCLSSKSLFNIKGVVHGFLNRNFKGSLTETATHFGLERIITLKQIHSNFVISINNGDIDYSSDMGDAIVTRVRNIGIGVYTADCVPIVLVDNDATAIAVIHAGWRGTLSRIINTTLDTMESEFGIPSSKILAVIGPAVGRCCYEVGEEVALRFISEFEDWNGFMFTNKDSNYTIDLKEANRVSLINKGVGNVDVIEVCTRCNENFHSFRRDGNGVGKQLSFIGLVQDQ